MHTKFQEFTLLNICNPINLKHYIVFGDQAIAGYPDSKESSKAYDPKVKN